MDRNVNGSRPEFSRLGVEYENSARGTRDTERMHLLDSMREASLRDDHAVDGEDSESYSALQPRIDPLRGDLVGKKEFYMRRSGNPSEQTELEWQKASSSSLLCTNYRIGHGKTTDICKLLQQSNPEAWIEANSSAGTNALWGALCCFAPFTSVFEVRKGHIQPFADGEGGFKVAGEGAHCHCQPFWRLSQNQFDYSSGYIQHGDWGIAIIEQGHVGFALDKGQPVLLPPGFHHWRSPTLRFQNSIDLSDDVIFLGPYTLLTVDEGYAAVTQNNGRQEIKGGGSVHLLTHRNHKFERLMTTKHQTDDLQAIEVSTGDNVLMSIKATVNWMISDVSLAAVNAADTQNQNSGKLRNNVLKQAAASLAAFIGTMRFSDSFSPQSQVQAGAINSNELFDTVKLIECVSHSNLITNTYGVTIISINIISAKPVSKQLTNELSQGAVAAADAQQLETAAKGEAKALIISSKALADSSIVEATANADIILMEATSEANAREEYARGALNAAKLIEQSEVAIDLNKIHRTGQALHGSTVFFNTEK